jgi:hypothetical protein
LGLKGREGKKKPGSPGPKIEMPNEAANMGWGDSNSLSLSPKGPKLKEKHWLFLIQ